ncbi:hypothetical protein D3C76_537560 [compost metagenome]
MDKKSQAENTQNRWIFWAITTTTSAFLLTEHATRVQGVLPYPLLAACPLRYLFMAHNHGDHQQRQEQNSYSASEENQP